MYETIVYNNLYQTRLVHLFRSSYDVFSREVLFVIYIPMTDMTSSRPLLPVNIANTHLDYAKKSRRAKILLNPVVDSEVLVNWYAFFINSRHIISTHSQL